MAAGFSVLVLLGAALAVTTSAAPVSVAPSPKTLTPPDSLFQGDQNPTPDVRSSWTIFMTSDIPAIHCALIPGSDDLYLLAGRPSTTPVPNEILAGVIDVNRATFTPVNVTTNPFCGAMVQTTGGKILVPGGGSRAVSGTPLGTKEVRLYDYEAAPTMLPDIATMGAGRWYPTPVLLPDSNVLILGGSMGTNENSLTAKFNNIWDPRDSMRTPLATTPLDESYFEAVQHNFYPYTFVLPTGEIWTQLDAAVRIMKPDGSYRMDPTNTSAPLTVPGFPVDVLTQYPRSATAVMTALEPPYDKVEIILFGGVPASNQCRFGDPDMNTPAVRSSYRISVTWQQNGDEWEYTFGEWIEEDMGIARSGGDATLLPNGDVVLVNGGQTGCPGGTAGGQRRNSQPAFWSVLYQPDREVNNRITILAASTLARMYHSTAVLTRDGHVLVGGCDSCNGRTLRNSAVTTSFWEPSSNRQELREEIYKTPYSEDLVEMPAFVSINDNEVAESVVNVTYNSTLTIVWNNRDTTRTDLVPVTNVSLVAPSSVTHGFNNNQRVVMLDILSNEAGDTTGTVTVQLPGNKAVAPPQQYLVFLLHGKTYSRSRWVWLR